MAVADARGHCRSVTPRPTVRGSWYVCPLDSGPQECYSLLSALKESGAEVNSYNPSTERRRSERALQSLPLIVRGVDLLGQPFEERTSTLAFNSHGCRYTSTHHLPRNSWVTLELPAGANRSKEGDPLRARVAWVQRPHSIRDFFQIAVELETPAEVWKSGSASDPGRDFAYAPADFSGSTRPPLSDQTTIDRALEAAGSDTSAQMPEPAAADSPLIRELRSQLQKQIQEAAQTAAEEAQHKVTRTTEENERKLSTTAEETFGKWRADLDQL